MWIYVVIWGVALWLHSFTAIRMYMGIINVYTYSYIYIHIYGCMNIYIYTY